MDSELEFDEMKTLARNKQPIWYSLCTGKAEIIDANGFRTGQYQPTYAEPVKTMMNIRWDDGAVRLEGFGLNDSAKRRLVTDDMSCPIGVGTIIWIGIEPTNGVAHNYVVSGSPQKSLTQIVYIVEEVNVSKHPVVSV